MQWLELFGLEGISNCESWTKQFGVNTCNMYCYKPMKVGLHNFCFYFLAVTVVYELHKHYWLLLKMYCRGLTMSRGAIKDESLTEKIFFLQKDPCLSKHSALTITNNQAFQKAPASNKKHKTNKNFTSRQCIIQSVLNTKHTQFNYHEWLRISTKKTPLL